MKGDKLSRMVGTKLIETYNITIAKPKGTVLCDDGVRRNGISKPYMPKLITDEYHPGGNSICYVLQTAHHMAAKEMILMGFTLKSGGSYFFGDKNPVTKRASIYDERRSLDWLIWFETTWPGKAKLVEGWDGPVYDILDTVSYDELLDRKSPKRDAESEDFGWLA